MTYKEQLAHPKWQRKRLEVFDVWGFVCDMCGDEESQLHIHHKHYIKGRMAWEYDNDLLVPVCKNCHEQIHLAEKGIEYERWCSLQSFYDYLLEQKIAEHEAWLDENEPRRKVGDE